MRDKATARVREHAGGGLETGANRSHAYDTRRKPPRQGPRRGDVEGGVWWKSAHGSRHMLQTPLGWAADVDDIGRAEALGATLLCIRDVETGRAFWAALTTLRVKGFIINRGAGPQRALTLSWWRPTREGAEAVARELAEGAREVEREQESAGPVQMGLWG